MGTESLTVLQESRREHEEIVVLQRNSDGDPAVHGKELAEFLSGFEVTQGMVPGEKVANGGNCLAAQVIAHFKGGCGGFYLQPTDSDRDTEWLYIVTPSVDQPVKITIYKHSNWVWSGTAENLLKALPDL